MKFSDEEIHVLLEQVFLRYQLDIREYSIHHIRRRISHRMRLSGYTDFNEFSNDLLLHHSVFEVFFRDLSILVTEMFREPFFYLHLRNNIIPLLKSLEDIRIWIAGCATGEEVYSLVILLMESDIFDKSRIIATDFNENAIEKASRGEFSLSNFSLYNENYKQAGGIRNLNDYFITRNGQMKIDPALTQRIVLARHNLVSDRYFSGVDLLLCRNVLIYFSSLLQSRVLSGFSDSLNSGGFLCLGMKEEIFTCGSTRKLVLTDREAKVYRKIF